MSEEQKKALEKQLWAFANLLRIQNRSFFSEDFLNKIIEQECNE